MYAQNTINRWALPLALLLSIVVHGWFLHLHSSAPQSWLLTRNLNRENQPFTSRSPHLRNPNLNLKHSPKKWNKKNRS